MGLENTWIILKYLFLGIFQGFTEPIPISSSGHLVIAQEMLGIDLPGLTFEVLVNFASLLAVLLIYRKDLIRLIINGLSFITTRSDRARSDFNFILYLIIGTIPAGVIGVLFGDYISDKLAGIKTVGITLLVTGLALWIIRKMRGHRLDADLSFLDAIIVGLAQAVALIPGISRSGATIVAAMGLGMNQETALRFSFLLFIPISVGTMVFSFSDLMNTPDLGSMWVPYTVAFIGSLVASYFSLKWFMNVMAKGNLIIFAVYCFVAGTAVLLFS
ncbi:undecaprenyl-diphosphate phosphatase [Bacillus marinisedimentorum]|uniref:undecaprenyl-diphosphate phosphatase n=1 Tax=Bacillus marinisedimentorum TaxID=1821260 RepID=UPI000873328A|nr:undecaprenyl-diphosphate phosphatase [Bacillus marinisedimentorum]